MPERKLSSFGDRLPWILGFVAAVVVSVWSHQTQWHAEPVRSVAYALIGLGWLGTAWLLWRQPEQLSNARLFLLLAFAWIVGETARQGVPVLYQVALFVGQYPQILCGALLLRYPRTRFDRPALIYFASGLFLATLIAIPTVLLAPGPGRPGDAPGLVVDTLGPFQFGEVDFVRSLYWAVYAVVFLGLFLARWQQLTGFERRTLTPILLSALLAAVVIGAAVVEPVLPPATTRLLKLIRGLAGLGVSVAFLASAMRLRMARATVADLVERFTGPVSELSLQEALIGVFEDPSIEVVPHGAVAEKGLRESGRLVLPISGRAGQTLAWASFSTDYRRHVPLLTSHLAACGLALENARQLQEVQETRSRLVQVGLDERRRLERDLHDGAQQRLLALGLQLGALEARAESSGTAEEIRRLRGELRKAQQELRDLAHGIYPTVLTQAGLGPALESVIERLAIPATLSVPARRWDQNIENALYLVACEAIANTAKHAGPCRIRIEVQEVIGGLELLVEDTGAGFDTERLGYGRDRLPLRGVRDRLSAMNGRLSVSSAVGDGTAVRASIPLPTAADSE